MNGVVIKSQDKPKKKADVAAPVSAQYRTNKKERVPGAMQMLRLLP